MKYATSTDAAFQIAASECLQLPSSQVVAGNHRFFTTALKAKFVLMLHRDEAINKEMHEMKTVTEIVQAAEQASAKQREKAFEALLGEECRTLEVEPYTTLRSVAKQTGISVTTLWRWRVPGHELGGRRRFKMSEVLRFLEGMKAPKS